MQIQSNQINLEVLDSGGSGPAILLIMGLGMQLIMWPPALLQGLQQAGYRTLIFDNRDSGLSRIFDAAPTPGLVSAMLRYHLRLPLRAPYGLQDMAQDALGVLDALELEQAHVLGVSMGGMIAQRVALTAPLRVLSLCSIMSSSGARHLPGPNVRVLRTLLAKPQPPTVEHVRAHYVRLFELMGSPSYPTPRRELEYMATQAYERAWHPAGAWRQMLAVAGDYRRARELRQIVCPTLVIHGDQDPLVPLAAGQDTARRIPGAKLRVIEGMGHDLADGVVAQVTPALLDHLAATTPIDAAGASAGE